MARITMRQTAAGPVGPFDTGKTYTIGEGGLSREMAQQFVNVGAAYWEGGAPVERAVLHAPETRTEAPAAPVVADIAPPVAPEPRPFKGRR